MDKMTVNNLYLFFALRRSFSLIQTRFIKQLWFPKNCRQMKILELILINLFKIIHLKPVTIGHLQQVCKTFYSRHSALKNKMDYL